MQGRKENSTELQGFWGLEGEQCGFFSSAVSILHGVGFAIIGIWLRKLPKKEGSSISCWILAGIAHRIRIALPYILLRYVNKQLTRIKGYTGHVDDIDVALNVALIRLRPMYMAGRPPFRRTLM